MQAFLTALNTIINTMQKRNSEVREMAFFRVSGWIKRKINTPRKNAPVPPFEPVDMIHDMKNKPNRNNKNFTFLLAFGYRAIPVKKIKPRTLLDTGGGAKKSQKRPLG